MGVTGNSRSSRYGPSIPPSSLSRECDILPRIVTLTSCIFGPPVGWFAEDSIKCLSLTISMADLGRSRHASLMGNAASLTELVLGP